MKTRHWVLAAALVLTASLGYSAFRWRPRAVPARAPARPSASAVALDALQDPVSPQRLVRLDGSRELAANWLQARPGFQNSRSAAERGGVEPCATQKTDTTAFEDWTRLSKGRFTAPRELALDASGRFDLVVHLNGDDPVRRELVKSGVGLVLYTLTLDPSQGYAPLFSGTQLLTSIIAELEQALSKRSGVPAHVGRLALSAWSAGFVGIEAVLAQPQGSERVDAVILIDGLHAPRGDRAAFEAQLKPFVDFAARAAKGERFFFVSHSSIDPPGFASTTECAHYLIASQAGKPQAVRREDALGLELVEYFSRGEFHVRGYAGNDKADHCAQLALLNDAYAALGRRWSKR